MRLLLMLQLPALLHENCRAFSKVPAKHGFAKACLLLLLQSGYAGHKVVVRESQRDRTIAGTFRTDVQFHIGNIGTAPHVGVPVNSNAPFRTGASRHPALGM